VIALRRNVATVLTVSAPGATTPQCGWRPVDFQLELVAQAAGVSVRDLAARTAFVVAAAKTLHSSTAAAPLLALWGVGSFAGGLLAARLGGGARTAAED
jgi:hypothetical protein